MEMRLPRSVVEIIDRLESLGYEAYAVGGCVRDTLLGREPEDWDITTSAKPEAVKKAFDRTIDTGIEHGTVTVMKNHVGYEVTTYRIDGEYEDNRHPKQVSFTGNLVDDLERRDFTINAMAYNPKTGLVDAFDGTSDLKRRIIRCVGDPDKRFDEDALRMLRAVRFSITSIYTLHSILSEYAAFANDKSVSRSFCSGWSSTCSSKYCNSSPICGPGLTPNSVMISRPVTASSLMVSAG